jgi:hypothetical protein
MFRWRAEIDPRIPRKSHIFFQPEMRGMINGGTTVRTEPPWYRG